MAELRDPVERGEKHLPAAPLRLERAASVGGEAVEAAAARAGALHPAAVNQAAPLQAVERRVERGDMEGERAVRAALDQLGELVAVAVALLEQREDEGLGAALAQLGVGRHMPAAYV